MARKGKIGRLEILPEFLRELFNGNNLDNGSVPKSKLDSSTNAILNRVPKVYNSTLQTSAWSFDSAEILYTTTIAHNLGSNKLTLSVVSNNESLFVPFKILDNNRIMLYSDEALVADLMIVAI